MELHQRFWWEDRINTEVKSAQLGAEPQSGTGIPQDYKSPDETVQWPEHSTYGPYTALAHEGLFLPTFLSAPTWLDYVAKFANKMLTRRTKLSENQYQTIAQAMLEDKLIPHIKYLWF